MPPRLRLLTAKKKKSPASQPPRRRRPRRTELRALVAFVLALCVGLLTLPARAVGSVVVEIDAAAERLVDARSARRLVPLELSDVSVPNAVGRGAPALFFRVLGGADGSLRVELWERGEYHGQRALVAAGANPQLVSRRVALAAAELARRLARKRQATLARDERLRKSRAARELAQRERTQSGPLALRSELAFGVVPGQLALVGPRLTGEISLAGPLRLDFGAELWAGQLTPDLGTLLQGVAAGPSYRFELTRRLDLDAGVRAAALLLQAPGASSLDALPNQNSSWTARLDGSLRFQLALSRQVRAFFGSEAGALLRGVPFTTGGSDHKLAGVWLAGSLGVVITPRR
jgi:hypothetical protein